MPVDGRLILGCAVMEGRVINEAPVDPSANRRYVLQQLRHRVETYRHRHRTCETQYERHRREVMERQREEARRLQQLLIGDAQVSRKNQQRQGRNGIKMSAGDQQSIQGTSEDFQGALRQNSSPSAYLPTPHYSSKVSRNRWNGTHPGQFDSKISQLQHQGASNTWGYNGLNESLNPRSFSRSVSFPGHNDVAKSSEAPGLALPAAGQHGPVQQVKRMGANAYSSCVFSGAADAARNGDVQVAADDGDLQSIMQALDEENAFDILEEVMRDVPRETPSLVTSQSVPGTDTQRARSVPGSLPQHLRHAMFEERGHFQGPPVRSEAPLQYCSQQSDTQQSHTLLHGQSVPAQHQQPVSSGTGLPAQGQSACTAPYNNPQIQPQHQTNWQLHQESVQNLVLQEKEKRRQQLLGLCHGGGGVTTLPTNRRVMQHQPQITVQPPLISQGVPLSQVASNSGLLQSSEHSFQGRNHTFKAPQARRNFGSSWSSPSSSGGELLAPQPRDRSNSYHGQPNKLSVPYPTRSLTPPMRAQNEMAPDMNSLGSTTPFSHFLPGASSQASAPAESLSNGKGSTGSLSSLVSSLLYKDTSAPADILPSPATLHTDTESEFDKMLRNPPSGFDLLSEIGNCIDDSVMDTGATA